MNIHQELLKIFNTKSAITIFDIGACECDDSIRYAVMFPYSKIYAFEPIKENYKKCVMNTFEYRNIKVFNCALGKEKYITEMYVSSGCPEGKQNTDRHNWGNKSSSLLKPKEHLNIHNWCEFKETQPVIVDRIDNICSFLKIQNIDYIHMDCQGSELIVLQGAGEMIKNIQAIYLEISIIEMYANQPLKNDVEEFMIKNRFKKVFEVMDVVQGDQFWIRK